MKQQEDHWIIEGVETILLLVTETFLTVCFLVVLGVIIKSMIWGS